MAELVIYVWFEPVPVEVHRSPDGTWTAEGSHQGKLISAKASNVALARRKWARFARAKTKPQPNFELASRAAIEASVVPFQVDAGWAPGHTADRPKRPAKAIADPLSVAAKWIDAYRAGSVERCVNLYDSDATHICACSGEKLVAGQGALRAYWHDRFTHSPINQVLSVRRIDEAAVSIRYIAGGTKVKASLMLNSVGTIGHLVCGPSGKR